MRHGNVKRIEGLGLRFETKHDSIRTHTVLPPFSRTPNLPSGLSSNDVRACAFGESSCPDIQCTDDADEQQSLYCGCGYHGPLCSVCADGYLLTWSREPICKPCGESENYVPLIIFGVGLVVVGGALGVVFYACNLKATAEALYAIGAVKGSVLFFTLQVISNFAQISSQTGDKKTYPEPAASVASALGIANLDVFSFVSLRCMAPDTHFYTTLLFKTVGPFAIIALVFFYPLIKRGDPAAWRTSARYSLIFLELILPSTTTTIGQTLSCEKFDDGYFLRAQLSVACDASNRRRSWVAFASFMIFVYPIGECCDDLK